MTNKCSECDMEMYKSRGGKYICPKCGKKEGFLDRIFGSLRLRKREIPDNRQSMRISFYIFDSNKIEKSVSESQSSYAEGRFLEALYRVVKPLGGWKSLPGFMGCHGILIDNKKSGKSVGMTVLADWLKLKSIVSIRLAADFLDKLIVDSTHVGCIPYAIGIWPMSESMAINTHNAVLSSDVIGYLGNFSLEPNPRLSVVDTRLNNMHEMGISGSDAIFAAIASVLGLPVKMGIRTSGQCFGWLVSEEEIKKLELSTLEQTPKQIKTTQKIEEAKRAIKNGDIKHAIAIFEELAELTSNEFERNKFLEAAEDLKRIL